MKPLHYDQINPQTGTYFTWDDPNLRFVDGLGMYLEPGDPGYVPYGPPPPSVTSSETSNPKTRMPKSDYIKSNETEFSAQLTAFKLAIGGYATALGLPAAQVTAQANDADYYAYVVACRSLMQQGAQQHTAWRDLLRAGGAPPASGVPVPPTFPAAVPPVAPGVERRFRDLVQEIKAHGAYNEAMGLALGIEGATQSGPDFSTFAPEIGLSMEGGQVLVRWGWQGQGAFLDSIELCVDREDGQGFRLLTIDTTPGYVDTTPIPAAPARWHYKAIYRVGDQRVGQWSAMVSIAVG